MGAINPRLTLVGAGPGDPELLTIKGAKALADADVVLYDALVAPALLEHAPAAKKFFVGKRKGTDYLSQDEINRLIVAYALEYGHVVRLKGGDPFIFGRGSEELEYAASFGIPGAVISGISSSSAVPASLGISLTHRDVARSFWVVTGTNSKGELDNDVALAAKSTATVVILMGMSKIEEITSLFAESGKGNTPAAIIQSGTTPEERWAFGTVDTLAETARVEKLGSPAIIVIGETVACSLKWKETFAELFSENVETHTKNKG